MTAAFCRQEPSEGSNYVLAFLQNVAAKARTKRARRAESWQHMIWAGINVAHGVPDYVGQGISRPHAECGKGNTPQDRGCRISEMFRGYKNWKAYLSET